MPSSASTRLRVELQAAGENLNTWGDTRLNEALKRLEEAIADVTSKSLTGNVTLTSSNYVSDEARSAVLLFTDGGLSAAPTVTIPAVEKWYWVKNGGATYDVNIGPSGATLATVRAGTTVAVYCDGTNAYAIDPTLDKVKAPAAAVSLNSQKITSLANGTAATDAANLGQIQAPGALSYTFSTTTTDGDPGAGTLRLNNATQSSATAVYIDDAEGSGGDVSAYILAMDDSTSTVKGTLTLRGKTDTSKLLIFNVTGLTDNSGYTTLAVSHVTGSAASPFSNADSITVSFSRAGDKGDTGATGSVTELLPFADAEELTATARLQF